MGTQQIGNAAGAFGDAQAPDAVGIISVLNSGATQINANEWVQLDLTGTGTHVYGAIRGVHTGEPAAAIGVALDNIAAGFVGRVIVDGPATAIAGAAAVSVGQQVGGSTVAAHDGAVEPILHYAETVAVPASGVAVTAVQHDRVFTVVANAAGVTTIQIGAVAAQTVPALSVTTWLVPAGEILTPTYTLGDPPTWEVWGYAKRVGVALSAALAGATFSVWVGR